MLKKRFLPVKENRLFAPDTYYSKIDWNDINTVIDAFRGRIEEWYLKPIENLKNSSIHFGFPIVGLTCLLIDTLSQYYYGEEESCPQSFKDFVRKQLPSFGKTLPTPIKIPPTKHKKKKAVSDYADALYSGFRCGILHEAHVPLYGMIGEQDETVKYYPSGYAKYVNGADCPSIHIDAHKLFAEVQTCYETYINNLKNLDSRYDSFRQNFRTKFAWSFGIDIGNES